MVFLRRNRESVLDVVIRCVASEGGCLQDLVRGFDQAMSSKEWGSAEPIQNSNVEVNTPYHLEI